MITIPPFVHDVPQVEDLIYQNTPSENPDAYKRINEFKDQFQELQKELKAMKGKYLFGKSTYDLCLVPNVKIPVKFKVHEFEKYKGNSYPQSHLNMHFRKMANYNGDDKLLIHYFQDNLTGASLKWYMGLYNAHISSFNEPCRGVYMPVQV